MSTPTIKLTKLGTDEVVAHACGKCGRVGYNEDAASQCCEPCICKCGEVCDRPWTACQACRDRKEAEIEAERFEAAAKVSWEHYEGQVWDGYEFYSTVEDYADGRDEIPRYLWAVTTRDLKLDAIGLIDSALETQGFGSGAGDWIEDESGLQRMLDEWADKQPIEAWDVDYSRAVLLDGIVEELWPDG